MKAAWIAGAASRISTLEQELMANENKSRDLSSVPPSDSRRLSVALALALGTSGAILGASSTADACYWNSGICCSIIGGSAIVCACPSGQCYCTCDPFPEAGQCGCV